MPQQLKPVSQRVLLQLAAKAEIIPSTDLSDASDFAIALLETAQEGGEDPREVLARLLLALHQCNALAIAVATYSLDLPAIDDLFAGGGDVPG